jgi:hypothetical protein
LGGWRDAERGPGRIVGHAYDSTADPLCRSLWSRERSVIDS